jgi:hypothetical protein
MRTRLLCGVTGLAVLLLTGCDSGSASSSGGTSTANTNPTVSCPAASVVNEALGTNVGEATPTKNGIVTVCQYDGGGANIIVRFQTESSGNAFQRGRDGFTESGQDTTDVAGVAEQAYSSSLGGINTLVARKGALEVLITAPAPIDKEKALAAKLLSSV